MIWFIFLVVIPGAGVVNLYFARHANDPTNKLRRGYVQTGRLQLYGSAAILVGIAAWIYFLLG